jgi:hypothetical protein
VGGFLTASPPPITPIDAPKANRTPPKQQQRSKAPSRQEKGKNKSTPDKFPTTAVGANPEENPTDNNIKIASALGGDTTARPHIHKNSWDKE